MHAAVERGRAAFEAGNLMSALREVKQALALDPADEDALALSEHTERAIKERQDEARIRAAVGAARRQFAAGEYRAAVAALEGVQPASHALVRAALDEFRLALNQIEEQRRIETELAEQQRRTAALGAEALTAISANRLDDAGRILTAIRNLDPSAASIAEVSERLRQAQADVQRREEAGQRLADFDARLADGDLARADEALKAATALAPEDRRLAAAKHRFAEATRPPPRAPLPKREPEKRTMRSTVLPPGWTLTISPLPRTC